MKNGYVPWIGIDFDGTLAYHESGDMSLGEPIDDMVEFILELMDDDNVVKIMTALVRRAPGIRTGGHVQEGSWDDSSL
jgi:hypothetical protein